uniref:Uncharacterized protein n=1 Tax=Ditylenchus dipsaci TaxID=166011 RepID=A0A915EAL8_9BILA
MWTNEPRVNRLCGSAPIQSLQSNAQAPVKQSKQLQQSVQSAKPSKLFSSQSSLWKRSNSISPVKRSKQLQQSVQSAKPSKLFSSLMANGSNLSSSLSSLCGQIKPKLQFRDPSSRDCDAKVSGIITSLSRSNRT